MTDSPSKAAAQRGPNGQDSSSSSTTNLDLFLLGVESKLKVLFSSLELTKVISTEASRNQQQGLGGGGGTPISAGQYLQEIGKVFRRTDPVYKMRILVSLLGLEPYKEHDDAVEESSLDDNTDLQMERILQIAQEPSQEEWVRVIAGLVQGVLFDKGPDDHDDNDDDAGDSSMNDSATELSASFYGKEAKKLLEKTCTEILQNVQELEHETGGYEDDDDDDDVIRLETADADPTFAPFRYALLNPNILAKVMPETGEIRDNGQEPTTTTTPREQQHFRLNGEASVLHMDEKLEAAKEEAHKQEQERSISSKTKAGSKANAASLASRNKGTGSTARQPVMPGMRDRTSTSKTAKASRAAAQGKSSLFMPAKKPAFAKKPLGGTAAAKVGGTIRRKRTAQDLVGKSRALQISKNDTSQSASSASGGANRLSSKKAAPTLGGRTGGLGAGRKMGNARSKMKMIDVAEVQDLTRDREEAASSATKDKGKKLTGVKRKASAASPASQRTKQRLEKDPAANTAAANGGRSSALGPDQGAQASQQPAIEPKVPTASDLAAAALTQYQNQLALGAQQQQQTSAAKSKPAVRQQDWQQLLSVKNNRLSEADRARVVQFFKNGPNPTPGETTYKLKLHEDRTTDPNTGEPIKETFYLELDYNTRKSKQFKKIKRYKD